jgi:hypothetical protein
VSESPASGLFSNYIVDAVKNRLSGIDSIQNLNDFTPQKIEQLFTEIIQDFYSIYGSQLNPSDALPKSTFILYLSFNSNQSASNQIHYFFYLGDGKIALWDNQTSLPPSEFLLEYHNETGALLNALRKDLSGFTKQYPISKLMLTNFKVPGCTRYVLFASDGLEPYYEEFLELLQQHPDVWEMIQKEQSAQFQELLLENLFGNLTQIPNDDVSLIFVVYND